MYFLTFYYFFIYQNPKSLCFSHSLQNSFIHAYLLGSGHNPRKFVSFNDGYLQELKNAKSRKKMAKKFNIPLYGDKFDTNQQGATDKIVKLLCNRGMIDPFNDNPMEVAGAKRWE